MILEITVTALIAITFARWRFRIVFKTFRIITLQITFEKFSIDDSDLPLIYLRLHAAELRGLKA